jgi:hypothetical protein
MTRYYPFAIKIDGHRYTGDWSLMMGGRICVRSAFGSEIVDIGRARPENVAARALERIARAYLKRRDAERAAQERELAKLHRPRKAKKASNFGTPRPDGARDAKKPRRPVKGDGAQDETPI